MRPKRLLRRQRLQLGRRRRHQLRLAPWSSVTVQAWLPYAAQWPYAQAS
ncbi:hypothetical protein [Balneatrix alpica]|uniref:Uncharacterized protein n=1 Tax=Balneatrix alpica TaxID=75684 RepID=A0ABV5ZB39_9GAMM|nr:hypothetical protein [Balneatrix alpica]